MLISLWTALAYADLDNTTSGGMPITIPIMTMVAGGVTIVFSKSQAEKRGTRLGMDAEGSGIKGLTWLIRAGGLGLIGYGVFQLLA